MYKATIVIPNINGKGWLKDSIVVGLRPDRAELPAHCGGQRFHRRKSGTGPQLLQPGKFHPHRKRHQHRLFPCSESGHRLADSEYVVLFNNDAFAEPQWQELIRTAETDPKIFAVQSLMIRHFNRELADDAGTMSPGWALPARPAMAAV